MLIHSPLTGRPPSSRVQYDWAMKPNTVRCERTYHDEELDGRRVDIVGITGEHGMTIEVKFVDDNY